MGGGGEPGERAGIVWTPVRMRASEAARYWVSRPCTLNARHACAADDKSNGQLALMCTGFSQAHNHRTHRESPDTHTHR